MWADFIRNVTQQVALNLDTIVSILSPSVQGRTHQRLDEALGSEEAWPVQQLRGSFEQTAQPQRQLLGSRLHPRVGPSGL